MQGQPVCPGEVDTEAADLGGEEEDEDVAALVELVDQGLSRTYRSRPVLKKEDSR